jgi:ArsR family transcriptional regulator, virulence genes transcriptional regulator
VSVRDHDLKKLKERADEAAAFLRSLASRHRLMVLCSLVDREQSSGELAQSVGLSPSNLSQHLAVLREERLVATRRERTTIYYRIASTRVRPLLEELYWLFCAKR